MNVLKNTLFTLILLSFNQLSYSTCDITGGVCTSTRSTCYDTGDSEGAITQSFQSSHDLAFQRAKLECENFFQTPCDIVDSRQIARTIEGDKKADPVIYKVKVTTTAHASPVVKGKQRYRAIVNSVAEYFLTNEYYKNYSKKELEQVTLDTIKVFSDKNTPLMSIDALIIEVKNTL